MLRHTCNFGYFVDLTCNLLISWCSCHAHHMDTLDNDIISKSFENIPIIEMFRNLSIKYTTILVLSAGKYDDSSTRKEASLASVNAAFLW